MRFPKRTALGYLHAAHEALARDMLCQKVLDFWARLLDEKNGLLTEAFLQVFDLGGNSSRGFVKTWRDTRKLQ